MYAYKIIHSHLFRMSCACVHYIPICIVCNVCFIGRTGRAGRPGQAITLFTEEDVFNLRR